MSKLQVRAYFISTRLFCHIIHLSTFPCGALYRINRFWIPLTAFIVGTILSPKFKAVKTEDGEKLFMKWIFIKDVKEIG
jgi:hypothetical protein